MSFAAATDVKKKREETTPILKKEKDKERKRWKTNRETMTSKGVREKQRERETGQQPDGPTNKERKDRPTREERKL